MFFCEPCRVEREWPEGFIQSRGPCELCGVVSVCYDIPSRALPPPPPLFPTEEIACAAIRYDDIGVLALPAPARHHHIMWTRLFIDGVSSHPPKANQGFLTTKGRFVDRVEGLALALQSGQIEEKQGNPNELYSEDMWPTPPEARLYSIVKLDD